jgi:hypothetical protein
VIRSATTNLLLRSEEFGNAAWTLTRATISTNAETAPNGTLTADKLVEDGTAANTHQVAQNVAGLASGVAYTASIFIKAAGRTSALVLFSGTPFGAGGGQFFNLLNGTLGNVTGSLDRTATIEAYPNGWYKMSITRTTTASGTGGITVRTAVANSSTTDGDSTSGILIWGAQLEQSSTVGPYIPTTSTINSAPRFDHNPTTGESLGLLVEEQRTNLTPRSEEFNDAAWVKARASITPNDAASPSGAITADKIAEDNTANSTHVAAQVFTFAATTYTLSIFAKAAERSWVRLFAFDETTNFGCYFNLSAGTVGTAAASTGSIIPLADGWFRCVMTFTAAAGTGSYAARLATGDGADTYTGNGTSGLFLWGAQLEDGAFPTSYIPTTASAATRTADVVSITGTNFSSWYRQDEGTVFADITRQKITGFPGRVRFWDGTTANTIDLYYDAAGNSSVFDIKANNTASVSISGGGGALNTPVRAAAGWQANNAAVAYNGSIQGTDSSVVLPVVDRAIIANNLAGTIRRLTYWPVRLGNNVLQQVTQ